MDAQVLIELEPYDGPEPSRPPAYDPRLEVEIELIDEELVDPWFHLEDSPMPQSAHDEIVYEIDPVHPLRRLRFWRG